jgi:hypothetical protein
LAQGCRRRHPPGTEPQPATLTELQAEAEDHAKFVVTGIVSAYLRCTMKLKPFRPGSLSPLNRLKRLNRLPAPIGFTKSSMTDIG